jgi:succinate dehydrogenase/fumarate reductase cytochrome b subunit
MVSDVAKPTSSPGTAASVLLVLLAVAGYTFLIAVTYSPNSLVYMLDLPELEHARARVIPASLAVGLLLVVAGTYIGWRDQCVGPSFAAVCCLLQQIAGFNLMVFHPLAEVADTQSSEHALGTTVVVGLLPVVVLWLLPAITDRRRATRGPNAIQ